MGSLTGINRVENVEYVEWGYGGEISHAETQRTQRMGSLTGVNRVENVEYVEWGWPWRTCRTWRINSEERQKAPLTFRLNAPQVSLTNTSEQVFRIDRFAV